MNSWFPPSPRFWMTAMLATLSLACGMLVSQPAASAEGPGPAVVIILPKHEETIHDNTGAVAVAVALQGATVTSGYRLRVLMDGKPYGADHHTLEFTLEGVERGEHSLQVQLIDAKDALVSASPSVTFHLWQASVLFPKR